jgi:hypothetical protein
MAELISTPKDIQCIMSRSRAHHEAAILEFRRLLPKRKLVTSDQAANKQRALCDSTAPAMLQYYQHEATGQPTRDDRSAREELLAAFEKLLNLAPPK